MIYQFQLKEMAEGTYVKLTKDQVSLQDINPGELNQPIDVARVISPFSPSFQSN